MEDYIELPATAYTGPELTEGCKKAVVVLPLEEIETVMNDYAKLLEENGYLQSELAQARQDLREAQRKLESDEIAKSAEARSINVRDMIDNLKHCIDSARLRNNIEQLEKNAADAQREAKQELAKYELLRAKAEAPVLKERYRYTFTMARLKDVFTLADDQSNGKRLDEDLTAYIREQFDKAQNYEYNGRAKDVAELTETDETEASAAIEEHKDDDDVVDDRVEHVTASNGVVVTVIHKDKVTDVSHDSFTVRITQRVYNLLQCFDKDGISTREIVYAALGTSNGYDAIYIAGRRDLLIKKDRNLRLTPFGTALKELMAHGKV